MPQQILNADIKDSLKLLRLPFSIFLLPLSLYSFYYIRPNADTTLLLVLFIWHFLVYPASNGYNSFNDRDEGAIAGLENPPAPGYSLLPLCNLMDLTAILLSLLINLPFTFFVLGYIVTSRLYSYRRIRLKKYALPGFIIVFIFQGAWIFMANFFAFNKQELLFNTESLFGALASSLFIGCIYPLTQIYQHASDKKDNVTTLSMVLGERGTFIFSGLLFAFAALVLSFSFSGKTGNFLLFNIIMLPSLSYFVWWTISSFKNPAMINFRNTMRMLVLSSILNNIYFLILLFK